MVNQDHNEFYTYLTKLSKLKSKGVITEEEFAERKKQVLFNQADIQPSDVTQDNQRQARFWEHNLSPTFVSAFNWLFGSICLLFSVFLFIGLFNRFDVNSLIWFFGFLLIGMMVFPPIRKLTYFMIHRRLATYLRIGLVITLLWVMEDYVPVVSERTEQNNHIVKTTSISNETLPTKNLPDKTLANDNATKEPLDTQPLSKEPIETKPLNSSLENTSVLHKKTTEIKGLESKAIEQSGTEVDNTAEKIIPPEATSEQWQAASPKVRLTTATDLVTSMDLTHNKDRALFYANELSICMTENSLNGKMNHLTVSELAGLCSKILGWSL